MDTFEFEELSCSSLKRKKSPPLTKEELHDIRISIRELKSGKGRHFNNVDDLLKELEKKKK